MVGSLQEWEISLMANMMKKLKEFLPQIEKDKLPSTNGTCEPVSYLSVRERKQKRLGSIFIKSSKKIKEILDV